MAVDGRKLVLSIYNNLSSSAAAVLIFASVIAGCSGGAVRGPAVYYPSSPEKARIKYLTHFSAAEDVLARRGTFSQLVFGQAKVKEEINKPYGAALYNGVLYACDTKRSMINVFDIANKRYGFLGFKGRGKLVKPINIAIDTRGNKYIADAGRKEIVVFDSHDNFVRTFGSGSLERPVDVAINGDKIFVCDSKASRILVFNRATYKLLDGFGAKGIEPGQFAFPTNIALDADGNVYVSDTINGRIQKLDDKGKHLMTYGRLGDMPGEFARPKGLAVDREGRLYVVDSAFENVQIFDSQGRLLLNFGEAGNLPGRLNLPAQVVVDYDNVKYFKAFAGKGFNLEYIILVTSQYGPRKINVYGFGRNEK